jgi:hypothetical protein
VLSEQEFEWCTQTLHAEARIIPATKLGSGHRCRYFSVYQNGANRIPQGSGLKGWAKRTQWKVLILAKASLKKAEELCR